MQLDWVVNFITQHKENKILVFFKWDMSFQRLASMLDSAGIGSTFIKGGMTSNERSRSIRNFFKPGTHINVMLIQVMPLQYCHCMSNTCLSNTIFPFKFHLTHPTAI
jgi:hypothetical protein